MRYQDYASQPDNSSCVTNMMYDMKANTGFDYERIVDWLDEQAEEEGVTLDGEQTWEELEPFFAEWYNDIDYNESCGGV